MRYLRFGQFGAVLAVCISLIAGCQTAQTVNGNQRLSQEELDRFFVEEFTALIGQRSLGEYAGYEHCCVILGPDLVAVIVALNDFGNRGLGSLDKFGISIGRSDGKVLVNLEPRYFTSDKPPFYEIANVAGYVYVVDLDSAEILDFYPKP